MRSPTPFPTTTKPPNTSPTPASTPAINFPATHPPTPLHSISTHPSTFPSPNLPPQLRPSLSPPPPNPQTINPLPHLKYLFSLRCKIDPALDVGVGPYGKRAHVPITGGSFSGRFGLNGRVMSGGGDDMIVVDEIRTRIDTRYILQTDDGAYIYVRTRGGRAGTPSMVASLNAGEVQLKDDWKCCLAVVLETGHERYRWLSDHTVVARMSNVDGDVCYDAYLINAYGSFGFGDE